MLGCGKYEVERKEGNVAFDCVFNRLFLLFRVPNVNIWKSRILPRLIHKPP